MAVLQNYDQASGAGTLRLVINQNSQDVMNNQSDIGWELRLFCFNGISFNNSPVSASVTINGATAWSGTYTFNFSGYNNKLIASGTMADVDHEADGSKTVAVSGYTAHTGTGAIGGPINVSGSYALDTIPRATTPTVSPTSGNTAATYTISHTPASSAFYHDVAYSLDGGATYTDITTNVVGTDTSTDWTPGHSLLPNSTSVTAIIRLITRASSGGSIIGTKTVNLPLTVPASVKPTVSSVSFADAQTSAPDLPTLMGGTGRFVQRWSKLLPTVTTSGASGSTVTDTDVIQNGQTTDSGTAFTNPITLSGSVPYTAYAYDSRSRTSDPFVSTVSVTAYNYPNLPVPTVTRTSDASGLIPAVNGTYLAITPNASTSSLNFSGEKNLLEWQVRTRPAGGSWTTVQSWTATSVVGVTWTTKYVVAGYSASLAHEVEVSVRDLFGKNGFSTSQTVVTQTVPVASESVALDIDGGDGIGVGEYRRSGYRLSVNGDIAQSGNKVLDTSKMASGAQTIAGTDATLVTTPVGIAAALAFLLPPGVIVPMAAGVATGWLQCDGSAVSRTTYAALFTAIGTIYGSGNGSTTFNLPNLKGRVVVGYDSGQAEFNVLGETGGAKTHTLTTGELPAHTHNIPWRNNMPNGTSDTARVELANTAGSVTGDLATSSTGGGSAHNNLQPYITLNYMIKT